MKLNNILLFLCLVITSVFLTGCGEKEHDADRYSKEKILLVGNGGEPTGLDPAFGSTLRDMHIMYAIYECLLILDPKTLAPCPGVAEDWDVSRDGLTYVFHLRNNARFSNGDPVTAHDFVFTLRRMLSPRLGSPNATFLDDIKNAAKYNEGAIHDFNEVGVKAVDDYTLQFTLGTPNPFFSVVVANWMLAPLHQATLEKFDAVETANNDWFKPENFVGNGPFTLKEWRPNEYVEVEKNSYYWDANMVKLDKIRFFAMSNLEDEAYAFCRGKLHVTSGLSSKHAATCAHRSSPYLRSIELNGLDMYLFNVDVPPLNDVRVRQALSIGINRVNLINDVVNDVFSTDRKIAYNIISSTIPGYRRITSVQEDIKKAQQLLAEAGFPGGRGFPVLELIVPDDKTHFGVALAVEDMWRRYLGIEIKVVKADWRKAWGRANKKDYQIIRIGWINDEMDATSILKNASLSGWNNLHFDKLLEMARNSPDIPTRYRYFAKAEAMIIDEVPIMPLFFFIHNFLVHPDVHGWGANSGTINYYQFIDLIPFEKENIASKCSKIPYHLIL